MNKNIKKKNGFIKFYVLIGMFKRHIFLLVFLKFFGIHNNYVL